MARFSRLLRGLQKVFPSSDQAAIPGPSELADSVVPTFEFPGRQGSIERLRVYTVTAVDALTPALNFGFANDGSLIQNVQGGLGRVEGYEVYTEIIFADLSHNSVTDRAIQMFMQTPDTPVINTAIGRWSDFSSARVDGQPSGFNPVFADSIIALLGAAAPQSVITPHRPILLAPGWKILITGDTAAAAWGMTIQMVAIVHPIAEPPLF